MYDFLQLVGNLKKASPKEAGQAYDRARHSRKFGDGRVATALFSHRHDWNVAEVLSSLDTDGPEENWGKSKRVYTQDKHALCDLPTCWSRQELEDAR